LIMALTLSPALISTFAAGLASGVAAAGVAAAGVAAGFAAVELSVVFGSHAEMANDKSAIARIFFIVSSVWLCSRLLRASVFAGEWRNRPKRFMARRKLLRILAAMRR